MARLLVHGQLPRGGRNVVGSMGRWSIRPREFYSDWGSNRMVPNGKDTTGPCPPSVGPLRAAD